MPRHSVKTAVEKTHFYCLRPYFENPAHEPTRGSSYIFIFTTKLRMRFKI